MPDNALTILEIATANIEYAFFTNEGGQSDAGYLINDQKTRNVNLYSSEQPVGKGFDPANRILSNIQMCFQELSSGSEIAHKFFMTSYYANMGKNPPLIISCDSLEQLDELKRKAAQNLYYEDADKSNPNRLGLEPTMRDAIKNSDISVIRADALIFKGIPGQSIGVLGASGDAHPIMMFDDVNKIACYISGAHAAIKQGVLEQSLDRMVALGADRDNIRLAIGPGLGPKSYEFGPDVRVHFSLQEADAQKVLQPVVDTSGQAKFLVNIKQLVVAKLQGKLPPENIHDIELDTMGFDLYDKISEGNEPESFKRKTTINFKELKDTGLLLFGARRGIMEQTEELQTHNPGAHNIVGRHGAGFALKP